MREGSSLLSPETIEAILTRWLGGESIQVIADAFGIGKQTVQRGIRNAVRELREENGRLKEMLEEKDS